MVLLPGFNRHGDAAGQGDNGGVADEAGFGNQHFVPGVHESADGQVNGLGAAHRHHHFRVFVVFQEEFPLQVVADGPSEVDQAGICGIRGFSLLEIFNSGLPDGVRGFKVRLPDAQGDDAFHFIGDVEEFPDAGGLQGNRPPGEHVFQIHQNEMFPLSSPVRGFMMTPRSL